MMPHPPFTLSRIRLPRRTGEGGCVWKETRLMFGEVSLMAGLRGVDLSQVVSVTNVTVMAG